MSNETAAYQAAHQRHHLNMIFGKKQRYIEVFQCSGEDMNHVLTGGATGVNTPGGTPLTPGSGSIPGPNMTSPVKPYSNASNVPTSLASMVGGAGNGLLPPGMFTGVQPSASSHIGPGFDPNSAILAAAQMQQHHPLLLLPPPTPPQTPRQPTAAEMMGLQQTLFYPTLPQTHIRQHLLTPNPAAAYNPMAMAQVQQQQLLQQQLLQSQLAAQRYLLGHATSTAPAGQPGLIGPRPAAINGAPKRSFDQAFIGNASAAVSAGNEAAKRQIYGNPTISAGPTTYHSR